MAQYRASGASEEAYLHERIQVQGIAARTAPLRAEAEKSWGEAERLYRESAAQPASAPEKPAE